MKITSLISISAILFLGGCADKVITESMDEFGRTVKTIASANTSKNLALIKSRVDIEKQVTKQQEQAGVEFKITGLQETPNDRGGVDRLVLFEFSQRPLPERQRIPERLPEHWSKEVFKDLIKYVFYGFTVDRFTDFLSTLVSGSMWGSMQATDSNILIQEKGNSGNIDFVTNTAKPYTIN